MNIAQIGFYFCLVSCIASIKMERNIINPLTFFSFIWSLVFLFSPMQLYSLNVASDENYGIILSGTVCFIVGCVVAKKLDVRRWKVRFLDYSINKRLQYKWLYIILFFCIIYYSVNFVLLVSQLGIYNLGKVQASLQGGSFVLAKFPILATLVLLVIEPITKVAPAIAASDFFWGKRDKWLFVEICVLLLARTLATANRTGLMLLFIYLIVMGLLKRNLVKQQKVPAQKKIKIGKFIVVGIAVFFVLTLSRGAELFRNVYCNFGMPPMMFEVWRSEVDAANLLGYGCASFNGFLNTIFFVLRNIIFFDMTPDIVKKMYDMITLTDVEWKHIGSGLRANAYVSLFWFFYLDGRIPGVVLGSFLYGFVVYFVYEKVKKNPTPYNTSLYCLILYGVMYSFVRFQFATVSYSIAIVLCLFFLYKKISTRI